jgi:hypothetical protein
MTTHKHWRIGDAVTIECDGIAIPGEVKFASPNGVSLMLGFEAIIDGHVGSMPVLQGEDGSFTSIMTGTPVFLSEPKHD